MRWSKLLVEGMLEAHSAMQGGLRCSEAKDMHSENLKRNCSGAEGRLNRCDAKNTAYRSCFVLLVAWHATDRVNAKSASELACAVPKSC
jgi:hypothetical protein